MPLCSVILRSWLVRPLLILIGPLLRLVRPLLVLVSALLVLKPPLILLTILSGLHLNIAELLHGTATPFDALAVRRDNS